MDEPARHQLYTSLESTLGPEPTSTLMSLLPPVGWADVATRQDLLGFRDGLRGEMHTSIRNAVFALIGAMFTLAGLTWAATSLT